MQPVILKVFRMSTRIFTSESVSEGHPDKVCDQISDAIVDLFLGKDPYARVAVETLATTDLVVLAGEVRCNEAVSHEEMVDAARQTVRKIGYDQPGFSWKDVRIDCHVHKQSTDIAMGVDASGSKDEGAGDQGIMFGFATKETADLTPAALHYAHEIVKRLAKNRKDGILKGIEPDAKSQVTLEYDADGKPFRAHSVVVSTQHHEDLSLEDVRAFVKPYIVDILPEGWMCPDERLYINPTGRFVIGGPVGDCGLTGRKIIVDTYGGAAPHGGGAFSGKDPTKVDRSAAYAARYLAKNIVAAGLAEKCVIQLSYAIGVSHPISVMVDTLGTAHVDERVLELAVPQVMDLSPRGIREHLELNKPIYSPTATYGHFGRTPKANGEFSWEKTDLISDLKTFLNV